MIAQGGRTVYPSSVGILMLETQFPRIKGDIGNGATWPFPVIYRVVKGSNVQKAVLQKGQGMLESFIEAGRELVADGADGITTSCGFLSLFQKELAAALEVPVATSSLMQAPMIQALLPADRKVGVITVSESTLTEEHLEAVGAPTDLPVVGTDGGEEFSRVFINNEKQLDVARAERDLLAAAEELVSRYSEVGAILLECTNMAPYASVISRVNKLPVFSIYTFISWFQSGLSPRVFNQ